MNLPCIWFVMETSYHKQKIVYNHAMSLTQSLIAEIGVLSYVKIFGISLLANLIIPVPEEIVILILGYLAGTGKINGFYIVPIIIFGLLISDICIYMLSKHGNKLVNFFYTKVFAKKIVGKEVWINQHLEKVVFFSRFLMQLRFLGPFFAGRTGMPLRKFITIELAALVIYVPFLVWAGGYFQNRIEAIVNGVGLVRNIVLIVFSALILIWVWKLVYNRISKAIKNNIG